MPVLESKEFSITFSESTGAIVRLEDKRRSILYIDPDLPNERSHAVPFRWDAGNGFMESFKEFLGAKMSGQVMELTWLLEDGVSLTAEVRILDGEARFRFNVSNHTASCIRAIEYPIFPGLHRIAGQGRDFLAHPYATGVLIKDPLLHFNCDGNGLRYMPYPESFSGCSAQFFTYYGQERGGLYFAAYDSGLHLKWLNFYHMHLRLEASHILGSDDIRPGAGLSMDYDFVLRFTDGDGWYEAADLYRGWALQQPWCAKGLLADLPDDKKPVWLLEKVGACTFGVNAGHNRTAWLKRYHEDIKVPVFHILGPDWTDEPQTFGSGVPGGYNDWFPTRFDKENLDTIHANGDYAAPFEFDLLVDLGKDDSDNLKKNLMKFPRDSKSFDDYHFRILCPHTQYTKDLHRRRDMQVMQEADLDSMYYDISANNLMMSCLSDSHGHPVGGSTSINHGFKDLYQDTKNALQQKTGRYIPIGTELVNEIFLDDLDYYQARSWALPSSTLEFWPIRHFFLSGVAEAIPLFGYVYSGYGPLRMDGWGKLVEETGELFYSIVARVYLWGGIYEINHEYSPMEALNGKTNPSSEHYIDFNEVAYAYSADRAAYLRQFAAFRTGAPNKYLAYGIMLPPPSCDAPLVKMSYYHYNHVEADASYNTRGDSEVPSVLTSAWCSPHRETRAVLLANTTGNSRTVTIKIDPVKYGMSGLWSATLYDSFDPENKNPGKDLGTADTGGEISLTLTLAPRSPYMIEFTKI
ncbi:DUF6259 domain-containing protein [uncultured Anaerotruncus sp.]|uniref:DUF6259 domain-containing protein n=1 Tax=uncultured Anaerotruncus sp. TaxID=905011 RepID=UPI00280AC74D|nr:DUF6259 domain-containing protein [uncultured Anaerotruncus sp.]